MAIGRTLVTRTRALTSTNAAWRFPEGKVNMRKVLIALGMACLLLETGVLKAQDRDYEADRKPAQLAQRTGIASPQFLIYQRAAKRAAGRESRILGRKWYGVSSQRPYWPDTRFGQDPNAHSFWHLGYNPWHSR